MHCETILPNSWLKNNEQYVELVEYANGIKLRLNQDEELNLPLMQSMAAMHNFFPDDGLPNKSLTTGRQFSALSVLAEKEAAKVLAREWGRVKKGERGFRYAKALAYLALALSLAGMVWLTTMAGHLTLH